MSMILRQQHSTKQELTINSPNLQTRNSLTMTTTHVAFFLSLAFLFFAIRGAKVTITNNCQYTVWPGTQANAGSPQLSSTGFELANGASKDLDLPAPWSGKFWGRTGCSNNNGKFSCATADCASGQVECNGNGEATPASLVEITAVANGGQDTYDVSNVDGFNVPSSITPQGGSGTCKVSSCPADINSNCPDVLQVKGSDGKVIACKSACVAFNTDQYCCRGAYNTSATCPPSQYSKFFKQQCPDAYSYAYDDNTSTFTCSGSPNYAIKFCP